MKLLIIMTLLLLMPFSYANNDDEVSLEQATESIRKESQVQVLSATTNNYRGVKSHRIQVLTESGRVKVYQVPANKNEQPNSNKYQNNNNRSNNSNNSNTSNNYRNIAPNNNSRDRKESKNPSRRPRSQNNRNIENRNKDDNRDMPSNFNRPTKSKRDR